VAKVGTGYTLEQLATIQYKLQTHTKAWVPGHTPPFLELTPMAELPHVSVDPRECCLVLEIRSASMEPSDKYRVGHTLRHPRVQEIRHDKGVEEVTSYEQIKGFIERGNYAARTYAEAMRKGGGGLGAKQVCVSLPAVVWC
jgi:ATP-dependent DNA ligase